MFVAAALMWPVVGDRVQSALNPDAGGCAGAGELPAPERIEQGRAAILCLLNARRAEHDLPPLREHPRLQRAAQAHAEDLGARDYFAHRGADGSSPHERIRRAGYPGSATGENLAWGERTESTPGSIVEGWMDSPGHRANILRREFREVGTGIAHDAPEPRVRGAAVYVNAFGG